MKGPVMGFFSPAWKVRTVSVNPDTGAPTEEPTTELKETSFDVAVSLSTSFLGKTETLKINVCLPYLS
eukprot:9738190-Alexandrium_andersonii.AAC.1